MAAAPEHAMMGFLVDSSARISAGSVAPVRSRAGCLQRKCACDQHSEGAECEACRQKREAESSGSGALLQRRASTRTGPADVPPIVHDVLRSPGQPLDAKTRAFFEPRFGHDFSRVRVHCDSRASESARAVNAIAYTAGNTIVFGEHSYRPDVQQGKALIAHELTHVIQQEGLGTSIRQNLTLGHPHGPSEAEADRTASLIANEAVSDLTGHVRNLTRVSGQTRGGHESMSPLLIQRQVPNGVTLKENKPFGHADLKSDADKEKFRTYIGAVTLMQLTPAGDYSAGEKRGDCVKEFLSEVSNTCPPHEFCGSERCLQVGRYGTAGDSRTGREVTDGHDTFIDRHITAMPDSFLEGSGKNQCSVVCHQHYKYRTAADGKYHDLSSFYIIRNFKAGSYKPPKAEKALTITTGEVRKVPAQKEAPTKEKFAKDIAPGLGKSGVLLEPPPIPKGEGKNG